jgi:hypothetical protein
MVVSSIPDSPARRGTTSGMTTSLKHHLLHRQELSIPLLLRIKAVTMGAVSARASLYLFSSACMCTWIGPIHHLYHSSQGHLHQLGALLTHHTLGPASCTLSSCTTTEMSREVTTVMVLLLLYSATLHLSHPPLAFSLRPYQTRASAIAAAHLQTGHGGQDMCRGACTCRHGCGLPEKNPGRVIFLRSQQFQ